MVCIINKGASSLQTQVVFRELVHDAVVNYRITTWIASMRTAISDLQGKPLGAAQ